VLVHSIQVGLAYNTLLIPLPTRIVSLCVVLANFVNFIVVVVYFFSFICLLAVFLLMSCLLLSCGKITWWLGQI